MALWKHGVWKFTYVYYAMMYLVCLSCCGLILLISREHRNFGFSVKKVLLSALWKCLILLSIFIISSLSVILWLMLGLILLISQQLEDIETLGFHLKMSFRVHYENSVVFLSTFIIPLLTLILCLMCGLILLIYQQLEDIETSGFHSKMFFWVHYE